MEDSEGQADHLQVFGTRRGGNVARLGAHVKDDAALQPWDEEVGSLVDDTLLDSRHTIKYDGTGAAAHIVYRVVDETEADGGGDGELVNGLQRLGTEIRHLEGVCFGCADGVERITVASLEREKVK